MSSSIPRYFPVTLLERSEASRNRETTDEPLSATKLEEISRSSSQPTIPKRTFLECDPDDRLIDGLSSGDTDALSCLIRRYAHVIRSVAYKILRDQFEAEDLLQEIFILVHKKAATFDRSRASVRFWILQMTYHRAITRRRYLACRHFYSSFGLEDAESQMPDSHNTVKQLERDLDSAAKISELRKLMAGLSDNQQKTLRLYFFEGYTLDEIASELGQTRDNIRNHYFRGLNKLRKQIFPNGSGRSSL